MVDSTDATGQSSDRVGDGDVGRSTGRLFDSGNLQDTVGVNLEDGLQDWLTSLHRWDVLQVEFTQQGVLGTVDTFTLVNWEAHGSLMVCNSGESSSLDCGDGSVSWDDWGKDVTLHSDTQRQWDNIQQQQVLGVFRCGLTGQDSTLNSSTVSNGFIRVDGLFQLLTIEEVRQQLLDLWNSGRTTNQDDFIDVRLGDLSVLQDLLDWVQGRLEQSRVDVFESGSGDVSGEVLTFEQGVDLNGGLGNGRQGSLSSFTGGSQSSQGSGVTRDVVTGLSLEFGLEVFQQVGVEILTTQVSVTSSSLDGENTTGNVQQGDIESTSTQVENQDMSLFLRLTGTQTVSNGSSGRLVNDTQNVQSGNGTSVLGGLSASVVEVSWDGNDSLFNLLTDLGLSDFLHFSQNHRGDFLWGESLGLFQVLNLDEGVAIGVDDLEWPGLDVLLDGLVIEGSTDQTLGVENGVLWVQSGAVLSGITDQSLLVGEGNEGRSNSVTLFVGDDFNCRIISRNTRIGGT